MITVCPAVCIVNMYNTLQAMFSPYLEQNVIVYVDNILAEFELIMWVQTIGNQVKSKKNLVNLPLFIIKLTVCNMYGTILLDNSIVNIDCRVKSVFPI